MRTSLSYLACVALGARSVAAVALWGQCGGVGYTGSTVCEDSVCTKVNDWYSQCLAGSVVTTTTTGVSTSATISTTRTTTSSGPVPTGGANIPRATFTKISDFGSNPTNVEIYAYVPTTLKAKPGLLVALHWCSGTAQDYYSSTLYKTYADQYGFIVIYPDAPDSGQCWDVHSAETLTHDAGGDSLGIASAIRYFTAQYSVDTNKVFATGTSSGAMMTNVLAGAYPDLIRAGAAFAGVPYGCFAGPTMWNMECSTGQSIKTPQEWGNLARSGYPGYTGPRPKMQLWHGSNDTVLHTQNYYEEIKQWTNVHGVSQTATAVVQNWPLANWVRSDYGPNVMGIFANGVDHGGIYVQALQVLEFFGLNQ